MNLLLLSPTVDTAGLGIAMKRAFDAYGGEWTARHVRTSNSWLDYPKDIQWSRDNPEQTAEVARLWAEADLVIIIERPEAAGWFSSPKPVIVWHLGTWYRRSPELLHAQCQNIGAREVVDMHELMRFGVTEWLPDIIDPAPLMELRKWEFGHHAGVRIAHAPTDRVLKSTDVIVETVERLAKVYPIEFDLIEKLPNAECLIRKARADIFIDELTLGYGLNALESWSMGQPVVSGIADRETRARMEADFGTLPFVNATADTLYEKVEQLVVSPRLRRVWGDRGRAHVEQFHAPKAVVQRVIELAPVAA